MVRAWNWDSRKTAGDHFGKAHQRGFELADVGRVFIVGVLVADGLGADVSSDFGIEPSSSIFPASLAGEGETPLSKAIGEVGFFEAGQISDFLDAEGVQVSFHDFADAGNFADVERGEEFGFFAGNDAEHSIGLGLGGRDFRDQARCADSRPSN